MQRIHEAQKKKMEDAQAFMLPSEKAKLKGKGQKRANISFSTRYYPAL